MYEEWLNTHRDKGFVLNCYYYPYGDAATLHLAACKKLLANNFNHTSPVFTKKCADDLGDLLNWAATTLIANVEIKHCSCLKRIPPG
jgi:hypothetical protein